MGAATRDTTARWTRAELDRFPDDGHRRELVDGQLLVSPLARVRHQLVVGRVFRVLDAWATSTSGVALPGVNVDLSRDTHLEPDVVWTSQADLEAVALSRTPEIVVEVGSPSTHRHDRGSKRRRYLSTGAREVWLVDLDRDELEVHRTPDGDPTVLGRGDTLTTPTLPGFAVDVDELLGPRVE